jgi:hypothetical protein
VPKNSIHKVWVFADEILNTVAFKKRLREQRPILSIKYSNNNNDSNIYTCYNNSNGPDSLSATVLVVMGGERPRRYCLVVLTIRHLD